MAITLGLAKTAGDIFKEALDLAHSVKNATLAEKLVELYQQHLELTEINQNQRIQIRELQSEIEESKKIPDIQANLEYVIAQNAYYIKTEDGKRDGPYCTVCWDVDRKLVRLLMNVAKIPLCGFCTRRTSKALKS